MCTSDQLVDTEDYIFPCVWCTYVSENLCDFSDIQEPHVGFEASIPCVKRLFLGLIHVGLHVLVLTLYHEEKWEATISSESYHKI